MAKVAIVRCADYDRERVFKAVKNAVDLLGGISVFVKSGARVLLKPNLLSARPPEEAVDTHPEVVRAVVRLVREAGGKPLIGDSPGGFGKNFDEVFKTSGVKSVADEEGAELVKFTSSKFVNGIPISRYIFDTDFIISIPKFKTHSITVLTGAVKNMFGTIVGPHKTHCHTKAPKPADFARLIAGIYSISKPGLSIVDGVEAMEGDGPSVGEPRRTDFVMAGNDGVAIDSCLARIMGLRPEDILTTKEAHAMGLGEMDPAKIEVAGANINDFIKTDFKLPQTTILNYIPKTIAQGVAALIRFKPYIDSKACKRCNLCKISCPVDCITIEPDYCDIDYKKCVRCLCCNEICPYRAIEIRRNVLTRALWG